MPYNPYLYRKYTAHINIKIYISVKAIKYINKYIYKGSDWATVAIRGNPEPSKSDKIIKHLYS